MGTNLSWGWLSSALSLRPTAGKLGGIYNVFGDIGSTLGPVAALPLVGTVGFAIEYFGCALLALAVGVLVSRTLLGNAMPTDAVPANN